MTPLSVRDLVPIVEGGDATHALDRKPDAALFPVVDACKTLAWINAQAGTRADSTRCHAAASCIQSASISEFVLPGCHPPGSLAISERI